MCGLVLQIGEVDLEALKRAAQGIAHRGLPGRSRLLIEDDIAIAHMRLPIVGLDREFDQPYYTSDDRWVAWVGEIHNYKELMPKAQCDTQYMVSAVMEDPTRCDGFWASVHHYVGGRTRVRVDYLAQKPLYWRSDVNVICSELAPLLEWGYMEYDRLYLSNVQKWGYDPSGGTPYRKVWRIPPGTEIIFDQEGGVVTKRKYYPELVTHSTTGPPDLNKLIRTAVINRLVSDVPVALLLSGGLDSAIIAACLPEGHKVKAFTIENGETAAAKRVAERFGLELEVLSAAPTNKDKLDAARAYWEPIDLGSVVPQYMLGKAIAAQGYHVVLSGDGADELFGGYARSMEYDSQFSDVFCELPFYHLPRLDTLMMRHTIELRCPFLASNVMEYALCVPHKRFRRNKQMLRDAFEPELGVLAHVKKIPLRALNPYDITLRAQRVHDFTHEEGAYE